MMNKTLKVFLAGCLFAALALALSGCGGADTEIDDMISQAKSEAARPVASASASPVVGDDSRFDQGSLQSKIVQIEAAKVSAAKREARLAAASAKAQEAAKSSGQTQVSSSPQGSTGTSTGTTTGEGTSGGNTSTGTNETGTGTGSTGSTGSSATPAIVYRKMHWGATARNNTIAIRLSTPVSAVWRNGSYYYSGYYCSVSVKNTLQQIPVVVAPSAFKLYMQMPDIKRTMTGILAGGVDGYAPFRAAILFPNENETANIYFAFAKYSATFDRSRIWAPDNSAVKWVRFSIGSPPIQFGY